MANVLIIGAGGVGRVVARKCAQYPDFFSRVCLAGRAPGRLRQICLEGGKAFETAVLNAGDQAEIVAAIRRVRAQIVINATLPFHNLAIMEACLEAGAHYLDTAVPEVSDELWSDPDDRYWYGLQWAFHELFRERRLTALLGIGSDPGMVNVFCAYARDELFDEIAAIDIMDVNAGTHGLPFATNFNPEINLRELQNPSHYWEDGEWHRADPFTLSRDYDFPGIGRRLLFSVDHDELHSLYKHFPKASLRFWMGFSPRYIDYFKKLHQLGLLSSEPLQVETADGTMSRIAPLKLLKALLPDPGSLGERYRGQVCIGCLVRGWKNGRERTVFIYNLCDHQACYRDCGAQAISYAAGVPTVAAALLLAGGTWRKPGVYNAEELAPRPFLALLPGLGLSWEIREEGGEEQELEACAARQR
ncbi:MAG: saccharopine dehydrogenase family protein [Deltaproteobacteria bacterium]|jgi:saccharopine dehydrogenase (NAD+, L-lysine-forming)